MEVLRDLERELSLGDVLYYAMCLAVCTLVLFNGWQSLFDALASGLR